jgi:hypothetical protein
MIMKQRYLRWAPPLIMLGTALLLYGRIDADRPEYHEWDLHHYRAMAEAAPALLPQSPAPFAFRPAAPWLAGLFPAAPETAFYLLSLTAAVLTILLLQHMLEACGIRPLTAAVIATLPIFHKYFIGFPVWDFYQLSDLLSLSILILLYQALRNRQWGRFALWLTLGVTVRETALLILPVLPVYLLETRRFKAEYRRAAAACLPGLILFTGLRLLIPHSGSGGLLSALQAHAGKLTSPGRLYALGINAFAPLIVIPLLFLRPTLRLFRRHPHLPVFAACVLISALFGSNDERLMAPTLPVFYLLIARLLQDTERDTPRRLLLILLWTVPTALDYRIGRLLLPNLNTMYLLSWIAMGLIAFTAAIPPKTCFAGSARMHSLTQ